MSGSSWQFRTVEGVVSIRDDAIVRKSTPRLFLAGQLGRWRNGDRRERASVAFHVCGFLLSVLLLVYHLHLVAGTRPGLTLALYVGSVVVLAFSFWRQHVRDTTIQRSAVERATLDPDEWRITITHGPGNGLLSPFRDDPTETTFTLGTADDLRKAREICRLRGIELEPAPADGEETETTYRIFTRDGACFCERCRRQVSPADATCPACEYALRVETSTAT